MREGDGDDAASTVGVGENQGGLEKALGADEIGLKVRSQRIASPGHAGGAQSGAAQQGVIQHGAHGSSGRQLRHRGTAHDGEQFGQGQTRTGKEPITGGPVAKLPAAGGKQTGHGVASQTE